MSAKQAAEKTINLGKQLKAVIEIGEYLDELGDLEVAKEEAVELKNKAESDRFDAELHLKTIKEKINTETINLKSLEVSNYKLYSDTKKATAHMYDEAKIKAGHIVANANEAADQIRSVTQSEITELLKERESVNNEVAELRSTLTSLQSQMNELRERFV